MQNDFMNKKYLQIPLGEITKPKTDVSLSDIGKEIHNYITTIDHMTNVSENSKDDLCDFSDLDKLSDFFNSLKFQQDKKDWLTYQDLLNLKNGDRVVNDQGNVYVRRTLFGKYEILVSEDQRPYWMDVPIRYKQIKPIIYILDLGKDFESE
jgi:hypothetical protein